jgi:opacity protein-like surface antigen
MKKSVAYLSALVVACFATSANANWQYRNNYKRDAWGGDDGMRFVLSARGGAMLGKANIKNDIGGLTGQYVRDMTTGEIYTMAWYEANFPSGSTNFEDAGYGRLGDLPAANDYKEVSFIVGVSAGFTMPDVPQWRVEFGFDHISETDYNANPLFEGNLGLSSGYSVQAQSGGVQSTLATDIYSVMAFYDFFDGLKKPLRKMIPYVGVGAGYADTTTVLQLTDSYGDLSSLYDLQNFGIVDDSGVIQFHKAENHTSNLVPVVAAGFSYGVNDRMFLDVGLRAMYINQIKWKLTNGETTADTEKQRDWFSAEKMMYVGAQVGLRVEF